MTLLLLLRNTAVVVRRARLRVAARTVTTLAVGAVRAGGSVGVAAAPVTTLTVEAE